jgi:hypothetical protein
LKQKIERGRKIAAAVSIRRAQLAQQSHFSSFHHHDLYMGYILSYSYIVWFN